MRTNRNFTNTFSEKYHTLFNDCIRSSSPPGNYWKSYMAHANKQDRRFRDAIDIKAIQYKLEQEKKKKEYPFTKRVITTQKAINSIRRNIDKALYNNPSGSPMKTKGYLRKKDLLDMLIQKDPDYNIVKKRNNFSPVKKPITGLDETKYPDVFVKQMKKKFPDFFKDGYFRKTFYLNHKDNLKIENMKKQLESLL